MMRLFQTTFFSLRRITKDTLINGIASATIVPGKIRRGLYLLFGMKIGMSSIIQPHCVFEGSHLPQVVVGDGVYVNYRCFFSCNANLIIEDNCTIGCEVFLCTSTHEIGNQKARAGKPISLPIRIGRGTWIGTRATILPGVTIGKGCVIAAGAVVTKDCKPNGLYAGIPAVRIKDLPQESLLN